MATTTMVFFHNTAGCSLYEQLDQNAKRTALVTYELLFDQTRYVHHIVNGRSSKHDGPTLRCVVKIRLEY